MHSLDRVLPIAAKYFMQTIGHKNQKTLNNERVNLEILSTLTLYCNGERLGVPSKGCN